MTLPLSCDTVIFDCDGVILQSNRIKSDAFALVLEGHDAALVTEFVDWHKRHGGVSRFDKFAMFFRDMLQASDWESETADACARFGDHVSQQLRRCPYIPGFEAALEALAAAGIPAAVNTGGAQDEVREVFEDRGIRAGFSEILGSPVPKRENMKILRDMGLIREQGVYFGDSRLDFDLAEEFGMTFVYVAYESEWTDGAEVTRSHGGHVLPDLQGLTFSQAVA